MNRIPGDIDRLAVAFDEESLVSDAGLLAVGTLMKRLGLEGLLDGTVRMGGRVGGSRPGRKILSLVVSMLLGGSHIDHADRLRAGSTRRVLPFRVMASSTLGTFLRSFTWGHVRQLDKALCETLRRFWSAGGGPKDGPVTVDVDGTVCEVSGKTKHGAAYGYTGKLGYHPLVAAVSETGEIVHARMRGGSSRKGHAHFIVEAVNRTRRAGATGPVIVRADSEFWSYRLVEELDDMGVEWSITLSQYRQVREAIAHIAEEGWEPIGYTEDGEAQVAETSFVASKKKGKHRRVRVVVRRTRLTDPTQAQLWPDWRYHAFATSTELSPAEADAFHRAHARVELAIRDIKAHAGLSHCPSGNFFANAAWLACTVLAHNLYRWTEHHTSPVGQLTNGNTVRTRLFRLPGRIVNHGGKLILRLPARWPWADTYLTTLASIRSLPQLC